MNNDVNGVETCAGYYDIFQNVSSKVIFQYKLYALQDE